MRWIISFTVVAFMGALLVAAHDKPRTIKFTKESLDKAPAGWTTGHTGREGAGVWKVVADDAAPGESGFSLAQTGSSPGSVFNLCVLNDGSYKDVEVSVMFRANQGEKDQGGGIVWRYVDADNYYIARVNPLEDNVRVYKVVGGKRSQELQNAEVKVPTGEWHALKIRMVGDHIQCFVDNQKLLDVRDEGFTKAGKVGLWTKADAQTSFDQFVVAPAKP